MMTFETTDQTLARRCRYAQYRNERAALKIEGSLVTGLIRSVREVASSLPARWVITVVTKKNAAQCPTHQTPVLATSEIGTKLTKPLP